MANKPKPINIHLLEGTQRKCRHGSPKDKPVIKEKISFTAPDWMTKNGAEEWTRITKIMDNTGVLTNADYSTLCQYCIMFGELKSKKGKFPATHHTQLRMCAVELGLTPSARTRINVPNANKKEDEF